MPRERLPPPAADEFYHADLIGLAAVTADGTEIGTVVAVHNFGAGDLLEMKPRAGGATIMLPFTEAFVPSVDIAGGRIVVSAAGRVDAGDERGLTMWRASVLTIFPEMFPGPLGASLAGKALAAGLWSLEALDIRAHATDKHRTVDDTPAGGGPGMVMRADVLARAIDAAAPAGRCAPAPADEPARRAADAGAGRGARQRDRARSSSAAASRASTSA